MAKAFIIGALKKPYKSCALRPSFHLSKRELCYVIHQLHTERIFVKVLLHRVQECKVLKVFPHQIQLSSSCPVGLPVGGGLQSCYMGRKKHLEKYIRVSLEIPWHW